MNNSVIFKEQKYYVNKPDATAETEAKLKQSQKFAECIKNNCCLRSHLHKKLKDAGVWSEEDTQKLDEIEHKLENNIKKLEEGGIDVMEARKIAIESSQLRNDKMQMMSVLTQDDNFTAEGQADNAYFDSLVSSCCYNEDGTKVFKSYDDYLKRAKEDLSVFLANELYKIIFGNFDFFKELPENQFLSEFGFIDDEYNFIDENGNKVDADYKPIKDEEVKKVKRKPFLKKGKPIK